ncbi:DUF3369 domain-containing protein, partial [Pelomonas sp. KK5]|uniref:DUF3369 domain-containing protein n=1 Tax=Pelomonas sp. KK5 TaxID=1855730 RepID=UPI00117F8D51
MSQTDAGADRRQDGDHGDDDDFVVLHDDAAASPEELGEPWLLLIVDDDRSIHEATEFALRGFRFAGRPLLYLNAYSAAEAREVLACNPGIACALVDVVMEHEHAGLELVGYIRQTLHNSEIRLILRTGQPGYAPEIRVIQDYDINDYKEKSFITGEQLVTSVTAALRSYQQIRTIQENRRGLERVIEASARLLSNCEIERFAGGILTQTAALLHTPPDGIVCVATPARQPGRPQLHVYAAAGSFAGHSGGQLDDETYEGLAVEVAEVLATRRNLFKPRISCLYVPATRIGEVVVVIRTMAPIGRLDRKLLELFCINIAVGLDNSVMVQKIENLAYVDQLTGLPNVVTLVRHMAEELDAGREYLLGLVSIDHFEAVNDGLGRDVGDYVLRHVGQQLRNLVHPSLVARAGGGVFAFVH